MQVIEVGSLCMNTITQLDSRTLVWIVGHVLAGWDGTAAQSNPTNLCELPSISAARILLRNIYSLPDVIICRSS